MPFLGKFGRDVNKTFSKRNVNRFFNKQLPDGVIKGGDISGQILGGVGLATKSAGIISGNPMLSAAGTGLMAAGGIAKGSSMATKGIQAAKK